MLPQWARLRQGESHVWCHLGPRWRGDPPSGTPAVDTCASVCLQSLRPGSSLRSRPGNLTGTIPLVSPLCRQQWGDAACAPRIAQGSATHTVGMWIPMVPVSGWWRYLLGPLLAPAATQWVQAPKRDGLSPTTASSNSCPRKRGKVCLNVPLISVSLRGHPQQVGINNILIIEKKLSKPVGTIFSICEHSSYFLVQENVEKTGLGGVVCFCGSSSCYCVFILLSRTARPFPSCSDTSLWSGWKQ